MSFIWDTLIDCKKQIIKEFDKRGREIEEPGMAQFNQPTNGWINRVWQTKDCRRCHIDVVDARDYHLLSDKLSEFKPDVVIFLAAVAHANKANKDPFF